MSNMTTGEKIICVLMTILVSLSCVLGFKLMQLEKRVVALEISTKDRQKAEQEILNKLDHIKGSINEIEAVTSETARLSAEAYNTQEFNIYTDLKTESFLTAEDMNKIINEWSRYVKGGSSFTGHGEAFIQASNESGLNPIMIFSIAALESGFGNSYLGTEKHNYFGIAAYDNNPGAAYHMGDSVMEGIIEGAKWIAENYYNDGLTCLAMMNPSYSSSKTWATNIAWIARKSGEYMVK